MKISKSSRLARFHIRKVDSIYNIPVSPEEAGFSKSGRVSCKRLIEVNSYSIVNINNAGDDPL